MFSTNLLNSQSPVMLTSMQFVVAYVMLKGFSVVTEQTDFVK